MMFHRASRMLFLFLILFSCKRDDLLVHEDHPSNAFDQTGKTFNWNQFHSGSWPTVNLAIAPNSVNSREFVEYYTTLVDTSAVLDSFILNYGRNDVNLFVSSALSLNYPAQLTIPFPSSVNFSLASGYQPYRVIINGTADLHSQLNDPANWIPVTVFSFDNTAKNLTFEITDLNSCFVIAKHL